MYENLRDLGLLPEKVLNVLTSKGSFAALGFLAGLSLFIEDPRRRAELAMYVLPKGLESAWSSARGKGYVMRTGELGDALVSGVSVDHNTCTRSITDSSFLFLPADRNRCGHGNGEYFETLDRNPAHHGSSPFFFFINQRTYQHDPHNLSGIVRRILYQFVGPN